MINPTNLATFDLMGVINHYGNMNSGHYTSYCKSSKGEIWYECNDSVVSELKTPVKTSSAYILVYKSNSDNAK